MKPEEIGDNLIENVFPSQQGNRGHFRQKDTCVFERIGVKSYNILEELQKNFTWP